MNTEDVYVGSERVNAAKMLLDNATRGQQSVTDTNNFLLRSISNSLIAIAEKLEQS